MEKEIIKKLNELDERLKKIEDIDICVSKIQPGTFKIHKSHIEIARQIGKDSICWEKFII